MFYTDNPLGNIKDLNAMPILSNSRRLLGGFSMNNKLKTKIEMT